MLDSIRSRAIKKEREFPVDEVGKTIDKLGERSAALFLTGLRTNGVVARTIGELNKALKPVERDVENPDVIVLDFSTMSELTAPIKYSVEAAKGDIESRLTLGKKSYSTDLPKPGVSFGGEKLPLTVDHLLETISTENELESFLKSPKSKHDAPIIRGIDLAIAYVEEIIEDGVHIKETSAEVRLFAFLRFASSNGIDVPKTSSKIATYLEKHEERLIAERIDSIFGFIMSASQIEAKKSHPGTSDTSKNVSQAYSNKDKELARRAYEELALLGIDKSSVETLLAARKAVIEQIISTKTTSLLKDLS